MIIDFELFFNFDTNLSESYENENICEKCDDDEEGGDSNPVGKLQEICMKKHWRPPHYETICEDGLPHERTFKMSCIIENMDFKEEGVGKSKRLAKRKAAHNMIKRLKDENLADSDDVSVCFTTNLIFKLLTNCPSISKSGQTSGQKGYNGFRRLDSIKEFGKSDSRRRKD